MTIFPHTFIAFSKLRMAIQGAEIRAWEKSDNLLLATTCKEIIEASGQEAEE